MKRGPFSTETVREIRDRTDLVDVVSQYLTLQKRGQDYVGLCPFHHEKTPSFSVSPSKQLFHCFGCHVGGDVFGFLMQADSLSFPDAVRVLGERVGISPRPAADSPGASDTESDRASEKEPLFQIHREAAEYYHHLLLTDPAAEGPRRYFLQRGVSRETIGTFQLGYALPQWDGLLKHLQQKGWRSEQVEKAGLAVPREGGAESRGGYYDRFRHRLIFPIRDLRGRVIAFGGRVLESSTPDGVSLPKYLNSPETPIYKKGQHLFALDQARGAVSRAGGLVIVEGYLDALIAHQSGVRHVAATLGTALTPDHLHLIRRFTKNAILIFDPDAAGVRAALRTVELFLNSGMDARVVRLPEGDDPDLFIRRKGVESFQRLLTESVRLMDFSLEEIISYAKGKEIEEKLKVVREILPILAQVSNHVERSHYLKWVADRLEIQEKDLGLELSAYLKRSSSRRGTGPQQVPSVFKEGSPFPPDEEMLLKLLLQGKIVPGEVRERVQPGDFSDGRLSRFFAVMIEVCGPSGAFQAQEIVQATQHDPDLKTLASSWALEDLHCDDYEKTGQDCMQALVVKRLKVELKALEERIRQAEGEDQGDGEAIRTLQRGVMLLKQQVIFAQEEVAFAENSQES